MQLARILSKVNYSGIRRISFLNEKFKIVDKTGKKTERFDPSRGLVVAVSAVFAGIGIWALRPVFSRSKAIQLNSAQNQPRNI